MCFARGGREMKVAEWVGLWVPPVCPSTQMVFVSMFLLYI